MTYITQAEMQKQTLKAQVWEVKTMKINEV